MADAVNLAASIIAIIQLAAKATSLSYGYFGAVKDAPTSAQEFMDELGSLTKVLNTLESCALANPGSPVLKQLEGPVRKCVDEMQTISKKLDPGKKGWLKKKIARYKWPLKEAETTLYLKRLERYKSLFTLILGTDGLNRSKSIGDDVGEVMADVKGLKMSAANTAQGFAYEKRKKILEWLYPGYFDKKHNDISTRRQEGTGEWLLKRPEFQDWVKKDPNSPLLLGYGIPGAGKTFLSSRVIDHLLSKAKGGSYGVAYIYFDYKERDQQKPAQAIACLIKQLLCQLQSSIPKEVEDQYETFDREERTPTLQDLFNILLMVTNHFPQTFIICDALDECDQKTQRRELLPLFHRMGQAGMNVFLTSREYPEDVQASLHDSAKIRLFAQEEDITSYVERKIEENPRAKRLVSQGNCKEKITNGLIECAKGMFLLVHFHIEYLCQQTTVREILKELEDIKNNSNEESPLDPTYDRAMENLRSQSKNCVKLAYKMLTWLVKARRVLTIGEIQLAVSVEQDLTALDDFDIADRKTLLEVCASLVTVDEQGDTVRLAHYTVQEYLVKNSIIPADAEFRVAMACTTFLSFDVFAQGACTSNSSFDARDRRYPFLKYAASNLSFHIKGCGEDLSTRFVLKFVKSPGCVLSYMQASSDSCYNNFYKEARYNKYRKDRSPIHIAAYLGHYSVARLLLEEGGIDLKADTGLTAVHEAARKGNEKVVRLLVENGADHSAVYVHKSPHGAMSREIPLLLAAVKGHKAVARLLLEKGSKTSVPGMTPLLCQVNEESMVRLLVEKGADLEDRDTDDRMSTPLFKAARAMDEPWIRLLLELGADHSARDSQGSTILGLVAISGRESQIRLLVKNGADLSLGDAEGRTALHSVAMLGIENSARVLTEEGASLSAKDEDGATSLHWAVALGHESLTQLLLEKGADYMAKDNNGKHVLHWAAWGARESTIKILLEKGAESSVYARDDFGSTILHIAADGVDFSAERRSIVQLFLERGVDPFVVDTKGETALAVAERQGQKSIYKMLEAVMNERSARITEEYEHSVPMVEEENGRLCS